MHAMMHAYNQPHPAHFRHPAVTTIYESNQTKLFTAPFFAPTNGTFEGFLLDRWFSGNNTYDALFVEQLPNALVRPCPLSPAVPDTRRQRRPGWLSRSKRASILSFRVMNVVQVHRPGYVCTLVCWIVCLFKRPSLCAL